jgi:hypothetical protein
MKCASTWLTVYTSVYLITGYSEGRLHAISEILNIISVEYMFGSKKKKKEKEN